MKKQYATPFVEINETTTQTHLMGMSGMGEGLGEGESGEHPDPDVKAQSEWDIWEE